MDAGLIYSSLRRQTGVNVVAHGPRNITDIVQTDHYRNYSPGNIAHDRCPQTVEIRASSTAFDASVCCQFFDRRFWISAAGRRSEFEVGQNGNNDDDTIVSLQADRRAQVFVRR